MHRVLIACLVCFAFGPLTVSSKAADRPNVLVVMLDDFGWRDCGFMGSDFYETPTLDRLASESMVFTDAYAAAANCAPSRACLLSGQTSPRHEIFNVGTRLRGKPKFSKLRHVPGVRTLRPDIRTWAAQVRSAGYRTGTIGKWHLSDDPLPYGFDFNFAGTHSGGPPQGYFPPHKNIPELQDAPADEYLTDRLTDEAVKFIDRNKQRPWLLYLTHFAVHTPIQAREDLIAKYQAKQPGTLHKHAIMAAMIQSVDDGMKRITETLDAHQLTDNTVILFTSDNGGYGPATNMAPLKGYKGTYYEGGIRVPFFVKWPGNIKAGTKSSEPISNIDIYPTLCELTGAALPTEQVRDGVSLVPLLTGQVKELEERPLYWHFPAYLQGYARIDQQRDPIFRTRPCSIMRLGDYKLHQYFEDGGIELYNLVDDIGESVNLAEVQPGKAAEMLAKLKAWQAEVNAPIPTELNPRYDAKAEAREIKRLLN